MYKQSKSETIAFVLLRITTGYYILLQSHKWIQKAMNQLHDELPVSIIVDVLRQASRVCVVKRDFNKAKYLIYQALGRASQHYGPESYKMAALQIDFGFYLLNSDQIEHCVTVYRVRNAVVFRKFHDIIFVAVMPETRLYLCVDSPE